MKYHANYCRSIAFIAINIFIFALTPDKTAAETNPLAHARTIQVQTKYSLAMLGEAYPGSKEVTFIPLDPIYETTVRIDQPSKVKAIVKEYRPWEKKKIAFAGIYAVSG